MAKRDLLFLVFVGAQVSPSRFLHLTDLKESNQ